MTRFEQKAKIEFENHAREELTIEEIAGAVYAFGSELACLRLMHKYRYCGDRAHTAYSENIGSWFFRLETL